MNFSSYQEAIFASLGSGNLLVEAKAGSGKTTTLIEICKRLRGSISFFAFNKSIADTLKNKGVPARTIHSLGLSTFPKGSVRVDAWKVHNIIKTEYKDKMFLASIIKRLVSLNKSHLELVPFQELIEEYDIIVPKGTTVGEVIDMCVFVMRKSVDDRYLIDYDDMIFFPIKFNHAVPTYDNVLIDEAQDLNNSRFELVKRAVSPLGKFIAVGDSHQAIYAFTGAMTESMSIIGKNMNCKVMPLSICYRCSRKVIAEAQKWVPDIECGKDMEGIVETIKSLPEDISRDDFILCRKTAPLIKMCLALLAQGKLAFVKGKEIGDELISIEKKGHEWVLQEVERLNKLDKTEKATMLLDKWDAIEAIKESGKSIESLFSDEGGGIPLMTIHKSKGLEARRVFILKTSPVNGSQEDNLKYVAATRAMEELYYVERGE